MISIKVRDEHHIQSRFPIESRFLHRVTQLVKLLSKIDLMLF